jgi:uncharacterized protein (AIM24 family)
VLFRSFLGVPRLVWLRAGWAVVLATAGVARGLIALADEVLVVREEALAALEGSLVFHSDVVAVGTDAPLHVAVIRGRGRVALESAVGPVRAVLVSAATPVVAPRAAVVAWTPAVTPGIYASSDGPADGPLPVEFRGDGVVLVAVASAPGEGDRRG